MLLQHAFHLVINAAGRCPAGSGLPATTSTSSAYTWMRTSVPSPMASSASPAGTLVEVQQVQVKIPLAPPWYCAGGRQHCCFKSQHIFQVDASRGQVSAKHQPALMFDSRWLFAPVENHNASGPAPTVRLYKILTDVFILRSGASGVRRLAAARRTPAPCLPRRSSAPAPSAPR